MNRHILFCNIAYMEHYDFASVTESPHHGGKYVSETGDALEKYNFTLCDDGKYRGFVETKYRDSYTSGKFPNQLRIENIDSSASKFDSINGVMVVFCAYSVIKKKTVIVGWYRNATVFRNRSIYDKRQYNLVCSVHDAFLLPENQRIFEVPRARKNEFGFGQSNVWYAKEAESKIFVESVFAYIDELCEKANLSISQKIEEEIEKIALYGETREAVIKVRVNQSLFRDSLLRKYNEKCCLCGVSNSEFLVASHIKPWSKSEADEKLDVDNGFLMCPNHDKLFDGGWISFDDTGRIIISDKLSDSDRIFLNVTDNMKLELSEGNKKYLIYHRDNLFRK